MSAAPPEGSLPPAESPPPPVPDAVPPVVTPPPVFAPPPAVLDGPPPPPTPVAVPPVFAPPPAALDAPPPAPVAVPPVFAPPPAVLDAPPPPVPVAEPPVFAPPPAVLGAPPPPTPVAVPPVFAPPPAILDTPPPAVLNTPPPAVLNTPPPAVLDAPPPAVLGTPPPVPAAEPPALSPPPVAVPPSENSSPPPPETPSGSPPPPATLSPPPIAIVPPGPPPPPKVGTSPPPLNAINPSISPSPNAGAASTKLSTGVVAGIAAGGGLLALLVLVALFLFCRKKRNKKDTLPYDGHGGASVTVAASKMSGMNDSIGYSVNGNSKPPLPPGSYNGSIPLPPDGSPSLGNSRVWFTYDELHKATNGFAQEKLLGEGGFGRVYKGELPTGQLVAVKQLTVGGGQGDREFRAEVEIISRVHHRHLVSLVGYCIADKQRLLVYDFVPNGTLDVNLYGKGKPVMTWEMRVRVALGAARGLAYLHEDCHPRIIHRDIKSSNILLDDKYEAQVADFGLAKPASDTHTHVSTRVMGTYGYLAPEYAQSGKLTEKSDVFSFGVMLLELITGRKPVDSRNPDVYVSLVEWARPLMTQVMEDEELDDFVDPRLDGDYDPKEMFRMIEVAASCVRHTANKRPKMGQVVRALESEEENAGLFQDLKPGHSSEHESDFDKFGGSDYDTQEYVADMMRMKKSHQSNRSYGSEYTSEYPSPSIAGSSGEYEPMIRPKTEPFMGRANNGKEHGPISVRSGRPSIPENRSRSETYSVPSRPPTRAAPPRPGQLNDSLVSSSDRSGSLRSDTVFVPPPPPPNYNEDYVSIDFNSLGSGKQEGRRKIMEEI